MKISIVGTGYVGLVTGTCFADTGINVTCVDIDENKITKLKNGIIPIYEPGLDQLVAKNVSRGRLDFSTNLQDAIDKSEIVFIAVGTPPGEDGSADLRHVITVARQIGRFMTDYLVVVTKSTVPIGTAQKVKAAIQEELDARGSKLEFDVASNPEFLKEGNAIEDFLKPDRIVVGTESERAEKVLRKLYKPFLLNGHPILFMDIPSAEMTKYAANAMLATRISFMNQIAGLCECMGADVAAVREGIGSDSRIGYDFLFPGPGYGGSCFPKDVKALVKTAEECNYDFLLLKAVEEVNERQKEVLAHKLIAALGTAGAEKPLAGKTVACWGLSFKPRTDDMREAPAITIIERLLAAGATVRAHDPEALHEAKKVFGDRISYSTNQYEILEGADALTVITDWSEYRNPDFDRIKTALNTPLIVDGRNLYKPARMFAAGFRYIPLGRCGGGVCEGVK